jgi:methylase of polypeptide subunit release factors
LQRVLPPTGTVLEISSGTGEHAVFFAPHLTPRQWLASDLSPEARHSIAAWRAAASAENLHGPLELDAAARLWPMEPRPRGSA